MFASSDNVTHYGGIILMCAGMDMKSYYRYMCGYEILTDGQGMYLSHYTLLNPLLSLYLGHKKDSSNGQSNSSF